VAEAIDPAHDRAQLVPHRQPTQLDPWLTRATTSMVETVRGLAKGLYEDYDAALDIGRRWADRLMHPLAFHAWTSNVPCALPSSPKAPMSQLFAGEFKPLTLFGFNREQ
jgi:hypothetical protein